jgi:hypothetical protein
MKLSEADQLIKRILFEISKRVHKFFFNIFRKI